MKKDHVAKHNWMRIIFSICIAFSIVFVMARSFRIITSPDDLSKWDHLVIGLWKPGIVVLDWITGKQSTLDRVWQLLGVSLIIYALGIWIILTCWARIRAAIKDKYLAEQ